MRVLIRFLRRGQAGAVEHKDRRFDGEAVTLGRSTDQVLQLKDRRVALRHARIVLRAGVPTIASRAPGGVVVNDSLCRESALAPGDVVRIGANVLRVLASPDGVDLAFSFELDAAAAAAAGEAGLEPDRLDLAAIGWRRRSWSWLAFAAVIVLALGVPAAGLMDPGTRDRLRASPAPDDGFWTSGPLAAAHHNLGGRCETCHAEPFRRVRNDACLDCHANVGRHYSAAAGVTAGLEGARCAGCHAEHNEPETLVRRDDALCAGCHADIRAIAGARATTAPVASFHDAHPQFRLSLLTPPPGGDDRAPWPVQRVAVGEPGLAERSRLKFPHDEHLDAAGIDAPDGRRVMVCADCHVPAADGRRMQPLTMEGQCADCHRLDFDPAFPDATVPHAPPAVVLQRLVEYYSRSYLERYPDPRATAQAERYAAVPGRPIGDRGRARLLQQARARALEVARDLFERRTCIDCHTVERSGDPELPWRVLPAKLTREWMPFARFSHARHATALTDCASCHDAAHSDSSADVLMPGIETCRDCHGGGDAGRSGRALVQSGCTLCHGFHDARQGSWARQSP